MSIKLEDCELCETAQSLVRVPSSTFITTTASPTKDNKKVGDVITTRIHEALKTGVKVHIDKEKKLIILNYQNHRLISC